MNFRVAVVGGGAIAEAHLEAIRESDGLRACAVADMMEERANRLGHRYGIASYLDDKEMLVREKPDIAVVALPHYLHKEAAMFAAEQGCHVMLEKPMAIDTAECDAIAEAVRANRVKLMVGHTQHYTASNVLAKEWIESGALGRLVMINDRRHLPYDKPSRPDWFFEKAKAGGGILTNLGSHTIDKIQWLTGGTVTRVKASVDYALGRGDVEGSGIAFLETDVGIPATMSLSGYPGAAVDETELLFTRGSMRLQTGIGLWVSEGGEYRELEIPPQRNPFVLQFEDLLRAIEDDAEPACSMAYSRSVVAAVQGLYRSHELGGEIAIGSEVADDGG
ncbi:Gfo/Idh/MocA family protein [Cohnella sp. REN36]|uniref:Gfo/Idh/MocA family protein n=1 Tax=Cohnella sp. REN36 TaxID=2887347 RepID=UPI001D14BFDB|nr:Gfo/Idh/MocA family oxidoreductase [Cohnella sp. REN36]MCC3374781.1 Gfo/Idh/MocA family oxidoreductase [Cohnella sp. REN36]